MNSKYDPTKRMFEAEAALKHATDPLNKIFTTEDAYRKAIEAAEALKRMVGVIPTFLSPGAIEGIKLPRAGAGRCS